MSNFANVHLDTENTLNLITTDNLIPDLDSSHFPSSLLKHLPQQSEDLKGDHLQLIMTKIDSV